MKIISGEKKLNRKQQHNIPVAGTSKLLRIDENTQNEPLIYFFRGAIAEA